MDNDLNAPSPARSAIRFILNCILVLLLVAITTAVTVFFLPLPRTPVPPLAIQLINLTTNATGRVATLSITNLSPTLIFVYMPRVIEKDSTNSIPTLPWNSRLLPLAGTNITIATPTNDNPWKLSLYVYNDLAPHQRIHQFLTLRRYHPHFIDSQWFHPNTITNVPFKF